MVVVVVETVVAAVELTEERRKVIRRRLDAEAFCEAEDVALEIAIGAVADVVVYKVGVERWIGCCRLCKSGS